MMPPYIFGSIGAGGKQDAERVHDYTNGKRRWGHDITWSMLDPGGLRLNAQGWGSDIRQGDYILLSNGKGTTRYQFESVDYYGDPSDMWKGILVFAPRQAEDAV